MRRESTPIVFIGARPVIQNEAKRRLIERITSASDDAYHIVDTLIFLREFAPENVAMDGKLQSEDAKIRETLRKITSRGECGRSVP
jgi:phenylpyruvate tautomerase PptA (4-oxalocrotonate tautomerase family)